MKGQERLDKCLKAGLVTPGTRFLWREHGAMGGPCREGTLLESVQDAEDDHRLYVRLDSSGAWTEPHLVFVEYIFPSVLPLNVPLKSVAELEARLAGVNVQRSSPEEAASVTVPINDKTKHPSRKPIK